MGTGPRRLAGRAQAAAGTRTLNIWTGFHGAGEVHGYQVNRRGAFAETCRGVERARTMGVSVGQVIADLPTAVAPPGLLTSAVAQASRT